MRTLIALSLFFLVGCTTSHRAEEPAAGHTSLLPEVPKAVIFSSYKICVQGSAGTVQVTGAIGSAVAISKRTLLTADHLKLAIPMLHLDPGATYLVDVFDKDGLEVKSIPAKMTKEIFKVSGDDLALLTVEEDLPHFVEFDKEVKTEVGDWVYTIGAQSGESPFNITWGQVATKVSLNFPDLWQCSAPVAGGNSGGGVYNARSNKLIGILVRGEAISFFVPSRCIVDFLKD